MNCNQALGSSFPTRGQGLRYGGAPGAAKPAVGAPKHGPLILAVHAVLLYCIYFTSVIRRRSAPLRRSSNTTGRIQSRNGCRSIKPLQGLEELQSKNCKRFANIGGVDRPKFILQELKIKHTASRMALLYPPMDLGFRKKLGISG